MHFQLVALSNEAVFLTTSTATSANPNVTVFPDDSCTGDNTALLAEASIEDTRFAALAVDSETKFDIRDGKNIVPLKKF
ncbi:hypothetical protein DSM106972_079180 [Dulcicalothrix desertica PCC 7102]|uniref:Uncharacterized protein n=1 Tax=Dulcicalothrix desertica PCC 7102 TaxID=232991 RepID=A0A433UZI1_9CYAN|nr:hypothetical protein DSM106972_079180 [Dulcicalothrix desertica PCC 7102]